MPRFPRRITRRDIRQPDRFVTLARQGISFFREQRRWFLLSLSGLAAVLLILLAWDFYRDRQNRVAAGEYTRAVRLYHEGRYREALDALARLESYRSSSYSRLGLLYTANSYMAQEEAAKAIRPLGELLRREKRETIVRQAALMALGYAQEKSGKCPEGMLSFAEAEKIEGPLTAEATLGKARCSAQAGNLKEAIASYRKLLTDSPPSEAAGEIRLRVQALEAKISEGSGAAK